MFKGVVIEKDKSGYRASLVDLDEGQLPEGEVAIEVLYSSLNYKDCLAITGRGPVVRKFPMVPGIDLAGAVSRSACERFSAGDQVLLTGWGVGESHWGGMAQKARVKGEWLVSLPPAFTPRQAMEIGTAGFTAMLCILALERHGVAPGQGDIVVTGATGGVGSFAVLLLSTLGYRVVAVTGRREQSGYVLGLGAAEVLDRSEFAFPGKPLGRERWAGAIDVVGGQVLANVCATTKYRGVVAACGLAGGMEFPATVAPFILRGITLVGIDSVMCPREARSEAWTRLAKDLDLAKMAMIVHEIGLSEAIPMATELLEGRLRGRVVVDVNR